MKRTNISRTVSGYLAKPVIVAGFAVVGAIFMLTGLPQDVVSIIDDAAAQQVQGENARQGAGGGLGQGAGGQGDQGAAIAGQGKSGGQQGSALEEKVFRGGKKALDTAAEEADDDSDRPAWAGGAKEENPHRPDDGKPEDPGKHPADPGGGRPGDAGKPTLVKGDEYGDLFVYVRDPVTGEPILTIENDVDGDGACDIDDTCYYQVYVCEDEGCTQTRIERLDLVWDEGSEKWAAELPEGVTSQEVEFGRASLVRAPDKVTDHALDELVKKLDTAATYDQNGNITALDVDLDEAGRLVIDGATVDSPLENAALYIALLSTDGSALDPFVAPLLDTLNVTKLDLAATAFAGSADKTGDITLDFVVYQNAIVDVTNAEAVIVPEDGTATNGDQTIVFPYYDYSDVNYDRTEYDQEVSYYYTPDGGTTVLQSTVNLMDFLDQTNFVGINLNNLEGAELFVVHADDALELIELTHTQIHDGVLPGDTTVVAPAVVTK
ncbi:MAG: hypothetical protein OES09_08955 [Gammaproteobacteria bacterium]|nr:hypothetical protein [Gammaproteobacteria bacterium]